jgi:transposase
MLAAVAAGLSYVDAARAAGVKPNTAKSWLARGRRESEGPYREFVAAVEQARERAQSRPEPMDEDELAVVVSEAARAGSVAAMKLRWEQLRVPRDGSEAPARTDAQAVIAEIDEVAAKRRQHGRG